MRLNEKRYEFADCPKCGRHRPINPDSGLCWDCGRHYAEPQLSAIDPLLREQLRDIDNRISEGLAGGIHTDDLARLIALREQLSKKI